MPTPCECGETVELNDMSECQECCNLFCRNCMEDNRICLDCSYDTDECCECGDRVEKGSLEKGGVCYPCKETIV